MPGLCRLSFFLIILIFSQTACRVKKPKVSPKIPFSSECPPPDSQMQRLLKNDVSFDWFSAKISAKTLIDDQSTTFSANLRIKRDSAIWLSITPALGIEVARVFITRDSLKFINRINGTFFRGDYNYLRELFKTEVNYRMIQSVLMGNLYLHYSADQYITVFEDSLCIMSSFKKRKIKKELELEVPEILTQEIFSKPGINKVELMEMKDYRPARKFSVNYLSFQHQDQLLIPEQVLILASASKSARIEMEFSRIQLNKELNLPFNIPDNYAPMH